MKRNVPSLNHEEYDLVVVGGGIFGICERTLWTLTRDGDVPHFKLGKSTLYPVDALREWLRERVREGSAS